MKLQGRNFGINHLLIPVTTKVASTGGKNTLSLEDVPNEHAGCPVVVKGFLVRYPKASITLTGSKIMDGVSAYQLAGTTSFAYAEKSPFHRAKGSRMAWSVLDGYTLGTVLTFCSRKPFFIGGGRNHSATDGAVAATDLIEPSKAGLAMLGASIRKRSLDWPQFLGAFAAADATNTSAVVLNPWFFLPFTGAGERKERGTPANWFSGKRGGSCSSQNAGYFEVELPATMDGINVTWTTSGDDGQFRVFAVVELADPKKINAMLPLCIDELEPGNNAKKIRVPTGHIEFLMAMKELSSGAMQAHDYTEVALTLNGDPIVREVCAENLIALGLALDEADGFSLTHVDDAHANAAAAGRRLLNGTPLVLHQGSTLKAPGSDVEGAMVIEIATSGESSHRFVCGYRLPMSDTLRAESEKWAAGMVTSCGADGAVVPRLEPASENGNAISSPAMAAGLPGVIRMVDAKAAAAGMKAPG